MVSSQPVNVRLLATHMALKDGYPAFSSKQAQPPARRGEIFVLARIREHDISGRVDRMLETGRILSG
jgi:hypothetical protein